MSKLFKNDYTNSFSTIAKNREMLITLDYRNSNQDIQVTLSFHGNNENSMEVFSFKANDLNDAMQIIINNKFVG